MIEVGPSERPEIRAVIFDMDGVLTDSEPLINAAAIAMFKEKGLVVQPEDFLPFVGTGEDRYIGGVAEKYGFALDLPAAKARTYELYLELVPTHLKAFPGGNELVQACRQAGLRVAVASSADRVKIEANLRHIGLPLETWDTVVVGEEVTNKKPAPDIFLTAAAKLGFAAAQGVVIEDAVNGVEAAKAAGMRCVAVAQTFPAERLQRADLVRRSLTEVSVADLTDQTWNAPGSGVPGRPHLVEEAPPGMAEHVFRGVRPSSGAATLEPFQGREMFKSSPEGLISAPEDGRTPRNMYMTERRWGLWATLGLTLVIGAAGLLAQMVVGVFWMMAMHRLQGGNFPVEQAAANGLLLSLATWSAVPVVVGLTYLAARIRPGKRAAHYLGFRIPPRSAWRWVGVMLLLIALSDGLTTSIGRSIVPPFMVDVWRTAGSKALLVLTLIAGAPLLEETLFRGFLFEGVLHSRLGGNGAILLSSLAWALVHRQYDLYEMSTIFVSGLFLGYVRLRTGSLYVTMGLHALMNLVATIELVIYVRNLV